MLLKMSAIDRKKSRKEGFTLIELIMTMVIVMVLAAAGVFIFSFLMQDALYIRKVPFDSLDAVEFNDEIVEAIAFYAYSASSDLAKERGSYSSFKGSKWDLRQLPLDTLALLEVDVPDAPETRAWLRTYARDVLRERFRQKAIYLKFVGPIETLIVTDEEIGDDAPDKRGGT